MGTGKVRLKGGLGQAGEISKILKDIPGYTFKEPASECHLGRDWAELKEYRSGEIFLFR